MPPHIALEYDDLSPVCGDLRLLEKLHEHYKDFKVSLFTIPYDTRFDTPAPLTSRPEWCRAIQHYVKAGWMEICVHGLNHFGPGEFQEITYEEAKKRIIVAERIFRGAKVPYTKIFKAPHWMLSGEGKQAIQDTHDDEKLRALPEYQGQPFGGFTVVEDHYYDWNLADHMPKEREAKEGAILVTHGHVQDVCNNGLGETFDKLMKLPPDTNFYFLSEAIHGHGHRTGRE